MPVCLRCLSQFQKLGLGDPLQHQQHFGKLFSHMQVPTLVKACVERTATVTGLLLPYLFIEQVLTGCCWQEDSSFQFLTHGRILLSRLCF